jgi:hypothetical protein
MDICFLPLGTRLPVSPRKRQNTEASFWSTGRTVNEPAEIVASLGNPAIFPTGGGSTGKAWEEPGGELRGDRCRCLKRAARLNQYYRAQEVVASVVTGTTRRNP